MGLEAPQAALSLHASKPSLRSVGSDERRSTPADLHLVDCRPLPDLSVSRRVGTWLMRSGWLAEVVVAKPADPDIEVLVSLDHFICSHLTNREAFTSFTDREVKVRFAVACDTPEERAQLDEFGAALAETIDPVVGSNPDVKIFPFDMNGLVIPDKPSH